MALAFGAAAVVLAFRLWKITQPTATKADTKQSQDEDEEYGLNNMSAEDRAYHERFMREAIAMVGQTTYVLPILHFCILSYIFLTQATSADSAS